MNALDSIADRNNTLMEITGLKLYLAHQSSMSIETHKGVCSPNPTSDSHFHAELRASTFGLGLCCAGFPVTRQEMQQRQQDFEISGKCLEKFWYI